MRNQISSETIQKAVAEVRRGGSRRAIARSLCIPASTLGRLLRRVKKVNGVYVYNPNIGNRRIFSKDEELMLADYIKAASKMPHGVTRKHVCKFALEQARLLNKSYPQRWDKQQAASFDWCRGFMKRHPDISLRGCRERNLQQVVDPDKAAETVSCKNLETFDVSSNNSTMVMKYPTKASSNTSLQLLASSGPQPGPSPVLSSSASMISEPSDVYDDEDADGYERANEDSTTKFSGNKEDFHSSQVGTSKAYNYVSVFRPRFSSGDQVKSRLASKYANTAKSSEDSVLKADSDDVLYDSSGDFNAAKELSSSSLINPRTGYKNAYERRFSSEDEDQNMWCKSFSNTKEVSSRARLTPSGGYQNAYKHCFSSKDEDKRCSGSDFENIDDRAGNGSFMNDMGRRRFAKRSLVGEYFTDINGVIDRLVTLSAQRNTGDVGVVREIVSLEKILRDAEVIY